MADLIEVGSTYLFRHRGRRSADDGKLCTITELAGRHERFHAAVCADGEVWLVLSEELSPAAAGAFTFQGMP